MKMNIYEQMNCFWELHDLNHFTTSERELFFFLMKEGNKNYWEMPFACPTQAVCSSLEISRATLTRARDGLKKRGVIKFSEGAKYMVAPTYTILPIQVPRKGAHRVCLETSHETTLETYDETSRETCNETISKDKEDKKNFSSPRAQKQSIDFLEKTLLSDAEWQNEVLSQLSASGFCLPKEKVLADYIRQFFGYLRMCKILEKDEADCRSHFFNKLRKEYLKVNSYGNDQQDKSARRGSLEVSVASAKDYEGAF